MRPWADWADTWRDDRPPAYLPVVSRSLRPVARPAEDDLLDDEWFVEEERTTRVEPLSRPVFEAWMARIRRTIVLSACGVSALVIALAWLR